MKHTGGCHCQNVRFEVEMELKDVMACNCSICSKRGHLLAFTPATNFKLLSGKDSLRDYTFNKHKIRHNFCVNCGIGPFSLATAPDGTPTYAINARCIDGIDIESLNIKHFDGKSL